MAMSPSSHSHAAEPGTRPKRKSVAAQQTLERVRNNQRRHRARQRDYVASLELKLSRAEESVTIFRNQVDALQAELAQCRNQDSLIMSNCPVLPEQLQSHGRSRSPTPLSSTLGTGCQAFGLLSDVSYLGNLTLPTPLPTQPQTSDDLSVELSPNLFSSQARPEDANEPIEFKTPRALIPITQSPDYTSETTLAVVPLLTGIGERHDSISCSASDLALQTTDYRLSAGGRTLLSAAATPDSITMTTGTCCSEGHSSKADDDKTYEHAVVLSRDESPLLPRYVVQPATEAYYRNNIEEESTMLCAEAYLLISQQNFKGVSQNDVATWLWHGFRNSVSRDEGCRVKTDLLFSLLTFISDA